MKYLSPMAFQHMPILKLNDLSPRGCWTPSLTRVHYRKYLTSGLALKPVLTLMIYPSSSPRSHIEPQFWTYELRDLPKCGCPGVPVLLFMGNCMPRPVTVGEQNSGEALAMPVTLLRPPYIVLKGYLIHEKARSSSHPQLSSVNRTLREGWKELLTDKQYSWARLQLKKTSIVVPLVSPQIRQEDPCEVWGNWGR